MIKARKLQYGKNHDNTFTIISENIRRCSREKSLLLPRRASRTGLSRLRALSRKQMADKTKKLEIDNSAA